MKKNDTAAVKITDIGVNGEGIGKVDGYTLFIKDAVIGDTVEAKVMKAKKNYGYARLMKVLSPSPDRVTPRCAFARKCGGCQIQEMSYGRQLMFKEQKVRGNLECIGGFPKELLDRVMEPVLGMEEPFGYRNKAQFPFGTDKEGNPVTGFYAGRTHDIIPNTDCALGSPVNREILETILGFMKKYQIPSYDEKTGNGLIRHVLIRCGSATGEIMVCLVVNGEEIPHADALIDRLAEMPGMTSITLSPNTRRTNVIMGDSFKVLWGQGYITDYIGNIKYQISPLSFYQVNPVQTEKLYSLALEYADLKGGETVWDLYCGIGTISLFLAQKHPELDIDTAFVAEAGMIHDIGIFLTDAPKIHCFGKEPYLCHGLLGAELMRREGFPRHARVCERHTGAGLTCDEIVRRELPLPHYDFLPETIEEKLICFADKFFSKTRPTQEKTLDEARRSIARFGEEGALRFEGWVNKFM